jgi:hypothetical protein
MKTLLCGLLAWVAMQAQQYPDYLVFTGAGYTRSTPAVPEAWVSGLVGLGAGIYSKTTVDMTAAGSNTMRTGLCKVFRQTGNWAIGSCVDAGVQTTAPVIGSFAGGGFGDYDLGGLWKPLAGVRLLVELRITGEPASPTSQIVPGLFIGIGKSF